MMGEKYETIKINKRVGNGFLAVVKRLFLVLMGIQILWGLIWLVLNFGREPGFYETGLYLKAAEEGLIDEYMGVLYPLLIFLAKWGERLLGLPYYMFMYVLQLLSAFWSVQHFLKRIITGKMVRVWMSGYLLTFPMLLQLHLAILPYSLVCSLFLCLISEGLDYWREKKNISGKALIKLCGLWLLGFSILPEYGWFMGIFTGGLFLYCMLGSKKWRLRLLMAFVSTILCFGVITNTAQTPGALGRIQKSMGAAALQRFVWPDFVVNSFFWEEKVTETVAYEDLLYTAQFPEAVIYEFGPLLEEAYGVKEAEAIYLRMAKTNLELNTKQVLVRILKDFGRNLCPPVALQELLKDTDRSASSWNYGRLQEHSLIVSKYYFRFAMIGWNLMCPIGILLLCGKYSRKGFLSAKKSWRSFMEKSLLIISGLAIVVWYTMSSGMQDYKKMMVISFFWLLPVIRGFLELQNREEEIKYE